MNVAVVAIGVFVLVYAALLVLAIRRPLTLYERSPLRFWQGVSALLAMALAASLLLRH